MRVDVAVVGAGGAGLSLLLALDRAGLHGLSVALVDPVRRSGSDRTWCYWDAGRGEVEEAVSRSWRRVDVVDRAGSVATLDLDPLRYLMVRSADLYALAERAAERLGVSRVQAAATAVRDGPGTDPGHAVVVAGDERVEARWVFDSRPAAPVRPARTALLQHFRGWTLRTARPAFAPDRAVLMDFRTPQRRGGLTFGYVLPRDGSTALVEYTEFSRARLAGPAYDAALEEYAGRVLGDIGYEVLEVEDGAIPMTDAVHTRRAGRRVVRLGTAGGATRASTGYTFAAMQRQARDVAEALRDGRDPVPPPAYPARHRWMDAVLLRALDRGHLDGADFFPRLFAAHPPELVLRFLDGATTLAEDLAVMRSSPMEAMARASVGDAAGRVRGRVPRLSRRGRDTPGA